MQILVKDNKVIGYATLGGFVDGIEISEYPDDFQLDFKPEKFLYIDNQIMLNNEYIPPPSEDILEQISNLKSQLASTDYKIIKYQEYILAALEPPYDIVQLNAERQLIRDKINQLEQNL